MASFAAGRRLELLTALAWAAALLALTAWLGRLDLLDPDEARHSEIAREMLEAGRWLVPLLHDDPYYQKPAAFYWLLGGAFRLFGENAAAARLPSVIAGLWTIFVTERFARSAYSREVAALAVAGLATTVAFVAIARTVVVDMTFTAALTSAFAWLGLWRLDDAHERRTPWPFYVAIAVATLIKGPAAILLAALIVAGVVARARDVSLLRALAPLRGALIVLAIALPWYVAAAGADPEYMRELLLHQNIERYFRPIGAGHVEPWYYYLVALPVGLLPWTPLVVTACYTRLVRSGRSAADTYCAVWAGAVLLFFLPAGTKLLTYVLPAFPPLICLAAAWASEQMQRDRAHRVLAPFAAAWTLIVAVAAVLACFYVTSRSPADVLRAAAVVLLPLAAFALAVRTRRAPQAAMHLATTAAGTLALVLVVYGVVAAAVNEFRDSRAGAARLRSTAGETGELVAYRCIPHAVAFYARKPAVRTRDSQRALDALGGPSPGALLTEKKRLAELGLDPLPPPVRVAWQSAAGLVMLAAAAHEALDGGEGRESNPPPTIKAGVTVLKTGRATGPDPSP